MRRARFWSSLWAQPAPPHSLLSRYIALNGAIYLTLGAALYLLPSSLLARLLFVEDLPGHQDGLVRGVGVAVAAIGWLQVFGGRTRADSFGLATIVDRAVIPALLLPLWWRGLIAPGMVLPFAILDPLLAAGAYVLWRRQRAPT